MNYFEILDLRMEPFSNSPDPDFLYRSKGHDLCLHELEIALRLRRGLSVVLGEVGMGKTTLCRELLRSLDEDDNVTAHLVLDPGFSSPDELVAVLHEMICRSAPGDKSPWQMKEAIKNTILAEAENEDQIMVLVVDEGQKMPAHCLEVLRELLNFETNDRKLLQIIIFAQREFEQSLAAMPNLLDRVNDLIWLEPMSLAETRAMVRHRLDKAKADFNAPELFTPLGWLALHRISGGYPRRIVRLAHKVMLGLIMRRSRKAGWRTVKACARENELTRPRGARKSRGWLMVPTVAMLCLALWMGMEGIHLEGTSQIRQTAEPIVEQVLPPAEAAVEQAPEEVQVPEAMAPVQATPAAQAQGEPLPEFLGSTSVGRGESLSMLLKAVYGRYDTAVLDEILAANPNLGDPDQMEVGQKLRFPRAALSEADAWWAQINDCEQLDTAVGLWRRQPWGTARVLPYRTEDGTVRFAVIAGRPRTSQVDAQRALNGLEQPGGKLVRGTALYWPQP